MSKAKLTKLTDFELLSTLARHVESFSEDEYDFYLDAEESNIYQQRFSTRMRDKMIALLVAREQESHSA